MQRKQRQRRRQKYHHHQWQRRQEELQQQDKAERQWHLQDPLVRLQTSGTTGEPEVVTLLAGQLLGLVLDHAAELLEQQRELGSSDVAYDLQPRPLKRQVRDADAAPNLPHGQLQITGHEDSGAVLLDPGRS